MTPEDIALNKTNPARRLGAAGLVLAVTAWRILEAELRNDDDLYLWIDQEGDICPIYGVLEVEYRGYQYGLAEGRRERLGWCKFCGGPDIDGDEPTRSGTCGRCWYGMRLEPEEWEAEMRAIGRRVEWQGGRVIVKTDDGVLSYQRSPYVPGLNPVPAQAPRCAHGNIVDESGDYSCVACLMDATPDTEDDDGNA